MTENPQNPSDKLSAHFTRLTWSGIQTGKHLANEFAMMPFLVFDLFNTPPFLRIAD
jgi:hypothetical protein